MNNSKIDYILEDLLYYCGKQGDAKSRAKESFYYYFLMERKDDREHGGDSFRAAIEFAIYQDLYLYLFNSGYLTDSKYCLNTANTGDGFSFTIDFGKLLDDVDIETELYKQFDGYHYDEYIQTLCHPSDRFRCDICGAISLSQQVKFEGNSNDTNYCIGCLLLKENFTTSIKKIYRYEGMLNAVKRRLKIVSAYEHIKIADNITPNELIDNYKRDHCLSNYSVIIQVLKSVLEKKKIDYLDVFKTDNDEIIIWNYQKITTMEQFKSSVITNDSGDQIQFFLTNPDVVWVDDMAIEFVLSLLRGPEPIKNAVIEL